jgi:hypothetical protein
LWNYTYVTLIGYHVGRDIYNRSVAIAIEALLENGLEPLVHNIPHRNLHRPLLAGTQIASTWGLMTLSYPAVNISSRKAGIVTVEHGVSLRYPRIFQPDLPYRIGDVTWINQTIDSAFIVLRDRISADTLILYSLNDRVYVFRSVFLVRWNELRRWIGSRVCKSGRTTGTICDGILLDYQESCRPRPHREHSYCLYANFTTLPGDSGSPIFSGIIPLVNNYTWVHLFGHHFDLTYYNGMYVGLGISVEALIKNGILPLTRLVLVDVYSFTAIDSTYGRVIVETYIYKLVPDINTTYDWYFYEVRITTIPGRVLYNNSWETVYVDILVTRNSSNTRLVSYGPLSTNGFNNGSAVAIVTLTANGTFDNFSYQYTYRIPYIKVTTNYYYNSSRGIERVLIAHDFNARFDPPGSPSDTTYTAIVGFVIRTFENTPSLVYVNFMVMFGRPTSSGNWEYVPIRSRAFSLHAYYHTRDPIR